MDLTGPHTKEDQGLLVAVSQVPELGRLVRRKYHDPLIDSGPLGPEILATVRAYLETGSRRDGADAKLHTRINTVGYRLARFTKITKADLADFTTLVELWWPFADHDQSSRAT